MQSLIKKAKVFLSGVILKDKTGGKFLKIATFWNFVIFYMYYEVDKALRVYKVLVCMKTYIYKSIISLIKKLTFFYMGMLCRRKMGENPQKSLFFVKKNCSFS